MLEIIISVIGLLASLICFLLMFFTNKKNKVNYDELQIQYRYKAYKKSFFTLILYSLLNCTLNVFNIYIFKDYITTTSIGIILSLFVFASTTIKNSSYIALREKLLLKTFLLLILGLVDTLIGIVFLLKNLIIENNQITFDFIYLFAGILFMILSVLILETENKKKKEEKSLDETDKEEES